MAPGDHAGLMSGITWAATGVDAPERVTNL